jgi:hypothetical protein
MATVTGPITRHNPKRIQSKRPFFIFGEDSFRIVRLAIRDTAPAAATVTMITNGRNPAASGSVDGQMMALATRPANVPADEARRTRSQSPPERMAEIAVNKATTINGDHCGKSRLGTIVTGHQHIAEPAAVRITKSAFLCMAIRITHSGLYGHLLAHVPSDLQGVARTVGRQCISRPRILDVVSPDRK